MTGVARMRGARIASAGMNGREVLRLFEMADGRVEVVDVRGRWRRLAIWPASGWGGALARLQLARAEAQR